MEFSYLRNIDARSLAIIPELVPALDSHGKTENPGTPCAPKRPSWRLPDLYSPRSRHISRSDVNATPVENSIIAAAIYAGPDRRARRRNGSERHPAPFMARAKCMSRRRGGGFHKRRYFRAARPYATGDGTTFDLWRSRR